MAMSKIQVRSLPSSPNTRSDMILEFLKEFKALECFGCEQVIGFTRRLPGQIPANAKYFCKPACIENSSEVFYGGNPATSFPSTLTDLDARVTEEDYCLEPWTQTTHMVQPTTADPPSGIPEFNLQDIPEHKKKNHKFSQQIEDDNDQMKIVPEQKIVLKETSLEIKPNENATSTSLSVKPAAFQQAAPDVVPTDVEFSEKNPPMKIVPEEQEAVEQISSENKTQDIRAASTHATASYFGTTTTKLKENPQLENALKISSNEFKVTVMQAKASCSSPVVEKDAPTPLGSEKLSEKEEEILIQPPKTDSVQKESTLPPKPVEAEQAIVPVHQSEQSVYYNGRARYEKAVAESRNYNNMTPATPVNIESNPFYKPKTLVIPQPAVKKSTPPIASSEGTTAQVQAVSLRNDSSSTTIEEVFPRNAQDVIEKARARETIATLMSTKEGQEAIAAAAKRELLRQEEEKTREESKRENPPLLTLPAGPFASIFLPQKVEEKKEKIYKWLSCHFSKHLDNGEEVKVTYAWELTKYQILAIIDEPDLLKFQEILNVFVKKQKPMKHVPVVDEIVLGMYHDEYYRARVQNVKENGCNLVFIDFGDQAFNEFSQIIAPNDEIMKFPVMSITVRLAGVPTDHQRIKTPEWLTEYIFGTLQLELVDEMIPTSNWECRAKLWTPVNTLNNLVNDLINDNDRPDEEKTNTL